MKFGIIDQYEMKDRPAAVEGLLVAVEEDRGIARLPGTRQNL